jgi:Uma2 family endonuclease
MPVGSGFPTRRFTADEYMRMVEVGILTPDDKVELLDGEIVEMSPQGDPHVESVIRMNKILVLAYAKGDYDVRPQCTHRAGPRSVPEPDVTVTPVIPGVVEVATSLLVVEVSDTSLAKDRVLKRRLYAEAGAQRYWIVEVGSRQVRVLEDPVDGHYRSERVVGETETLTLPGIDVPLPVVDILPTRAPTL